MVVTVASGGTAGDIDWAVLVSGQSGYQVSLVRGGYKLGLVRKGTDIVETDPDLQAERRRTAARAAGSSTRAGAGTATEYAVARTWHNSSYKT